MKFHESDAQQYCAHVSRAQHELGEEKEQETYDRTETRREGTV